MKEDPDMIPTLALLLVAPSSCVPPEDATTAPRDCSCDTASATCPDEPSVDRFVVAIRDNWYVDLYAETSGDIASVTAMFTPFGHWPEEHTLPPTADGAWSVTLYACAYDDEGVSTALCDEEDVPDLPWLVRGWDEDGGRAACVGYGREIADYMDHLDGCEVRYW